jgi:hypothetical protein
MRIDRGNSRRTGKTEETRLFRFADQTDSVVFELISSQKITSSALRTISATGLLVAVLRSSRS